MSRIPGRNFLFVPGPTNIPDRVQRAMMVAMEDHRSSKFPELSTSVLEDLKKVYKTEAGQVFTRQLHNLPVRTSVRPAEHEVLEP